MADVEVGVRVSDNGSLQQVGKNARTADRNLKGAAKTSANATKNFSKMAQGITGGLVPAYATLAANVFAITAAFNFLKNAADFENLRKGQIEFAQKTGVALGAMTGKLQEASGGMLGFKEAAQAAAIGTAKGFSTDQLEKLTIGARKAAAALGRDFEESFDRLVRGVSKAEPELLDELGITLRLETATKRYAQQIGKTADQLTSYERSQAVLAETQRQLDEQYGDMSTPVNEFVKLQKTFDRIVKAVTQALLPAFQGLAGFIADNATIAVLLFGALGLSIFKSIPGVSELGEKISNIGKGGKGIKDVIQDFKKWNSDIEDTRVSLESLQATATKKFKGVAGQLAASSDSKILKKASEKGFEGLHGGDKANLKKALRSAEAQYAKHGRIVSGMFKDADIKVVRHFEKSMKDMEKSSLGFVRTVKNGMKFVGIAGKGSARLIRSSFVGAFTAIKAVARGTMKVVNKLMKATIILGVVKAIFDAFNSLMKMPHTLAMNVAKGLANIAKTIQFIANLAVQTINAGMDALPDSFFAFIGKDRADFKIEKFTFADDADVKAVEMVNAGLAKLNISMDDLAKQEAEHTRKAQMEERLADLASGYTTLNESIQAAKSGLAEMIAEEKSAEEQARLIINSLSTTDLASEFRKALALDVSAVAGEKATAAEIASAQAEILGKGGGAALKQFKNSLEDISALSPEMQQAIDNLDITKITQITSQAQSAKGNYEAVKRGITDLTVELQKGGRETINYLESLKDSAEASDEMGEAIKVGATGAVQLLADAMAERGLDTDKYIQRLRYVVEETQRLKMANLDLQRQTNENRLSGAVVKQQVDRELAAEKALLEVRQQKLDTLNLENQLAAMNDSDAGYQDKIDEIELSRQNTIVLMNNAAIAKKEATAVGQILMTVNDSFQSSLASSLQGLIQGTMSVKDAFKNMALGVLNALSQIIAELMVVALVRQLALGGISAGQSAQLEGFNTNMSTKMNTDLGGRIDANIGNVLGPGNRYGGIVERPVGYSTGGIARGSSAGYPAILHGTEAVVPLPNGNAIPVEMRDGGGTNNVSITVNMNEGGSSSEQSGITADQAGQLGKLLSAAVQEELQNQKRPGGILSPYGAA